MKEKRLPGLPLYNHKSYGFEEHVREYGHGTNRLRTSRLAQPGALKIGDVLATGDQVLSAPREGGNGSVLIHLTGGTDGHWIGVPARIPVALLTKDDDAPPALWGKTECIDGHSPCKPTGGKECMYCGG